MTMMNIIFRFFKDRPVVSLLFIFIIWVNSLPLPEELSVQEEQFIRNNNEISLLNKNQINAEYQALIEPDQSKVKLAAFRQREVTSKVMLDENTSRIKINFEISDFDQQTNDLFALQGQMPEDSIVKKIYQLPKFGVPVSGIDLAYVDSLSTKKRLEYI